jgi:hypothetical protein
MADILPLRDPSPTCSQSSSLCVRHLQLCFGMLDTILAAWPPTSLPYLPHLSTFVRWDPTTNLPAQSRSLLVRGGVEGSVGNGRVDCAACGCIAVVLFPILGHRLATLQLELGRDKIPIKALTGSRPSLYASKADMRRGIAPSTSPATSTPLILETERYCHTIRSILQT